MSRTNYRNLPPASLTASSCLLAALLAAQAPASERYIKLPAPQHLALPHQAWEGDQQPHTLSVIEWNRGGYRYWGWYGLNNGRGMGLMRSNDLLHWRKLDANPLWLNARWPSVLKVAEGGRDILYFAVTRDYDTQSSRIVLARSEDGTHLAELGNLVAPVAAQRNQNPDLFHDPVSGKFFLTFYRGNDNDYFDIVSKSAPDVAALSTAAERVLMHTSDTVAAPNLLYAPAGRSAAAGTYYLATEIFPDRYSADIKKDWQVKVFSAGAPDGHFTAVAGNPVQSGGRACLFQHVFNGRYYGYQSRINHATEQWEMEVLIAPMPR
ncbi:MAG TPA: hypothetical protein VN692_16285 [Steroidobacteraceae bacterium]|nr:hypothetical protein [Steroidobacteraceae bacterium]